MSQFSKLPSNLSIFHFLLHCVAVDSELKKDLPGLFSFVDSYMLAIFCKGIKANIPCSVMLLTSLPRDKL
jgi:hypothetical protein